MNLDMRDKKTISDVRMDKAREFLSDAQANYDGKRYRSSVNRSYYAALNAVRSILALEGVNAETHEGSVTMLSLRFVKTGLLPVDLIKQFKFVKRQAYFPSDDNYFSRNDSCEKSACLL
jgi:uncharacterized protein (UPF0332 family)